jgi:hypothetical protein
MTTYWKKNSTMDEMVEFASNQIKILQNKQVFQVQLKQNL